LREDFDEIGLADAIIIETANQNGLKIVSGDPHFENLENILFLE
jgi:predicted nucleic acid-binding protein